MAKKREEATRRVSFAVSTKERPAFKEELRTFVFDSRGQLIDSAPVRDGKVEVSLSSGGLGRSRVFLVPLDEKTQGQRLTGVATRAAGRVRNRTPGSQRSPGLDSDPGNHHRQMALLRVLDARPRRAVQRQQSRVQRPGAHLRGRPDPVDYPPASRPRHLSSAGRSRSDILRYPHHARAPSRIPTRVRSLARDQGRGPIRAACARVCLLVTDPGSRVGFNPQPDPPGGPILTQRASALSRVALNPQPLPPRSRAALERSPVARGAQS